VLPITEEDLPPLGHVFRVDDPQEEELPPLGQVFRSDEMLPIGPMPPVPAQVPPAALMDYETIYDSQSTSPFNDLTFLAAYQMFELAATRTLTQLGVARAQLQRRHTLLADYYGRAGEAAGDAVSANFEAAGWWMGNTRLQAAADAREEALAGFGYAVSESLSDYYEGVSRAVAGYESQLGQLVEQGVAVGQDLAVEKAVGEYQAVIDQYLNTQYGSLAG